MELQQDSYGLYNCPNCNASISKNCECGFSLREVELPEFVYAIEQAIKHNELVLESLDSNYGSCDAIPDESVNPIGKGCIETI